MPVAAVIGGGLALGGSIYASNKQSKANKAALNAQQQANQQALDLQRQTLAQQQQNLAPYLQTGYSALDALRQQFGLPAAQPSGGQAGGYDIAAYIAANPDVAAARPSIEAQGVIGPGKQWSSFEDWVAREHLPNALANGEQRLYPTVQPQAQAGTPQAPGPSGPTPGPRETYTRPDVGSAPSMPDLSFEAYQQSPGYEAGLLAGQRNLNANFGARGLLGSGAAAQAAIKFGTDYQNQDYNNWRSQQLAQWQAQLNQYNQDRARTDSVFSQDRQFGTGVYDADRAFSANRYDQGVSNLFNLAQLGNPNQANALLGNSANTQTGLLQQGANNLSSYYGAQAANSGALAGNLVGIGQGLLGNLFGSGSSGLGSWLRGAASSSPNLF